VTIKRSFGHNFLCYREGSILLGFGHSAVSVLGTMVGKGWISLRINRMAYVLFCLHTSVEEEAKKNQMKRILNTFSVVFTDLLLQTQRHDCNHRVEAKRSRWLTWADGRGSLNDYGDFRIYVDEKIHPFLC